MGDEIPADLIAPLIPDECEFAYGAFRELSTDRQSGFGEGPIPWASIDAFAARYGVLSIDEFDHLCWIIRVLDETFLSHKTKAT
jgi:hypothetical protein